MNVAFAKSLVILKRLLEARGINVMERGTVEKSSTEVHLALRVTIHKCDVISDTGGRYGKHMRVSTRHIEVKGTDAKMNFYIFR